LGSDSRVVYYRYTIGLGDAIMCRPAIVENLALYPKHNHIAKFNISSINILKDLPLKLEPVYTNVLEKPDNVIDLSSPCLDKEKLEIQEYGKVLTSRQDIYCETVGVENKNKYNVSFTKEEAAFAEGFLSGMRNPIGIHLKANCWSRSYPFSKNFIQYLYTKYKDIVVFGDDVGVGRRFENTDCRLFWAVVSKLKLLIGVDSFGIHAAGSTGVPIYGVFGPTDPEIRLKYYDNAVSNKVKCKKHPCWYSVCKLKDKDCVGCLGTLYWKSLYKDIIKHGLIPQEYTPPKKDENIIIYRFRGIGDVLMTLPAIATYKKLYPKSKITYVTSKTCSQLLEFSGVVDDVIGIDYDHTASPDEMPPYLDSIDLTKYDRIINLINKIDFIPESKKLPRTMLFARQLGLVDADYNTDWKLLVNEKCDVSDILRIYGIKAKDKYIVLQVSSNGKSRIWNKERMVEFINCCNKNGYKVIGVSDIKYKLPVKYIDLSGELNMYQLLGIINRSVCVVSPDSASVHLAGVLDKPCVALYGSVDPKLRVTHYKTVKTIFNNIKCSPCNDWQSGCCENSPGYIKCMNMITGKQVFEEVCSIGL